LAAMATHVALEPEDGKSLSRPRDRIHPASARERRKIGRARRHLGPQARRPPPPSSLPSRLPAGYREKAGRSPTRASPASPGRDPGPAPRQTGREPPPRELERGPVRAAPKGLLAQVGTQGETPYTSSPNRGGSRSRAFKRHRVEGHLRRGSWPRALRHAPSRREGQLGEDRQIGMESNIAHWPARVTEGSGAWP